VVVVVEGEEGCSVERAGRNNERREVMEVFRSIEYGREKK